MWFVRLAAPSIAAITSTLDSASQFGSGNLIKNEDSGTPCLPYSFCKDVWVDIGRNARAHQHSSGSVNAGGGS